MSDWLELSYDRYPRVEEAFQARLDESLSPRGPDMLYDFVEAFALAPGSDAVDVGCGEGQHSLELAERFGLTVTGVDPVARHVELAEAAARERDPGLRVHFALGTAEEIPLDAGSADLVWCRDVLVHVADLDTAYAEFHRVLRPGARALVYQMFGTDRLEPREAAWLTETMGVVPTSFDHGRAEAAIAAAGLRVDERVDLGTEWGEWGQERSGKPGERLLYAARLLRDPDRYVAEFGRDAYDIMLGDCLWHVYGMIGKLDRTVYLLSKPA